MSQIKQTILEELKRIEREEGVRILYACESGSRAWGFPSRDSDYDVRFLYIRPVEWYLSIFDKRDVIERPISDRLDINGWDLKKRSVSSANQTRRCSNGCSRQSGIWNATRPLRESGSTRRRCFRLERACIITCIWPEGTTGPTSKAIPSRSKNISTCFVRSWLASGSRSMARCRLWSSSGWRMH